MYLELRLYTLDIQNMHSIKKNIPLIVLFGRPNVGKSTLFNCLTEKKQALVSAIEGTTRDSNLGQVDWQGEKFDLVDTGGIIDIDYILKKKSKPNTIEDNVQKQALEYLKKANLILFLVDAQTGILPQDKQMAMILKKKFPQEKIMLIVNKVSSVREYGNLAEFNKLSMGEPVPVSAVTGSGTGDMLDIIIKYLKKKKLLKPAIKKTKESKPIKVCILGKPNVGKSSLLNSLLGYKRVIVNEKPHTTREPQNIDIIYNGENITLIDTAGISKKGQKTKGLEKYGIEKTLATLKKTDVVMLILDISKNITHQDLKLIEDIMEYKKSFIIIANKWDIVTERETKKYTQYIYDKMPFATWAPIQFVSAKTGEKVNKIMDLVLDLNKQRNISLGESQLDRFLLKIVKIHPPSKGKGTKPPRIYKLKQTQTNPPKFEIIIGSKDNIHESYVRFIMNRLRDKFSFRGVPITIYVGKKRKIHGKHKEE